MSQELELPRPSRIFPSQRDRWIVILLVTTQTVFIISGIKLLSGAVPLHWAGIACLAASMFVGWIMVGTYYVIQLDCLFIRCGCFRWTIPLTSIQEVSPTRSLLSGPALSLERLKIVYQQGGQRRTILISPIQPEDFLADLKLAAPWVVLTRGGE